jgi:hypothetical protein
VQRTRFIDPRSCVEADAKQRLIALSRQSLFIESNDMEAIVSIPGVFPSKTSNRNSFKSETNPPSHQTAKRSPALTRSWLGRGD